MHRSSLALAAALACAASALAQGAHVVDESFTEADGDRVIQVSVDIPAPPEAVWERWSTEAGWTAFATPYVAMDFRVGGMIETSYGAAFEAGSPNNIKNEILAYAPNRALAIRAVQAPPGFPNPEHFFQTASLIELEPIAEGTKVIVTGTGFRPGAEFDQLYGMFRGGNAQTLENLRRSFVDGPIDWTAGRAEAEASIETEQE